jgi:predicted dehydrogenase
MNDGTTQRIGIIGCGDFLRIQADAIDATPGLEVVALADPAEERARAFADRWPGARVLNSADELLDADDVDIAAIFVPPWAREPLVARAAWNGKHIVTTKPLAPRIEDTTEMIEAVRAAGVTAGVIYNRSGNRQIETLKSLLDSGEFGRLALYRQDWLHHYPVWNTWALDPARNGGPFMDAMIHNLNIARYLMGRPTTAGTMFSDRLAHPDLPCADTESLQLDFADAGLAHLFISWAADLRVDDPSGNHREHIDIWYGITDQGWRITFETRHDQAGYRLAREDREEWVPLGPAPATAYSNLIARIEGRTEGLGTLASLEEAGEDIRIISQTSRQPGIRIALT